MTLGSLALHNLRRNPLRLVLTVLAGMVGVTAFVFLQAVVDIFYAGARAAQVDRLIVRNKAAFTQLLPLSYAQRIATVPGVDRVTHQGWFGGTISDSQRDFFPNFYVDPGTFLAVYDEYELSPAEVAAFKADPCGAVAGRELAERFGWKVGKRVVLKGTLFPGTWELTLRGIFDSRQPGEPTGVLFFGYRCVNERLPEAQRNRVGIFGVRVSDASRSTQVASSIDAMFANSAYPTRTESERAFRLGFVAMSSAIIAAVRVVSYVILLIILLVIANTLAMGVREKAIELATLRAIGFRRRRVVGLVLVESAVIGLFAAALGLLAAPGLLDGFASLVEAQFGRFPESVLRPSTLAFAGVAAVLVSLAAGAIPAALAVRPSVAEGLRKVA